MSKTQICLLTVGIGMAVLLGVRAANAQSCYYTITHEITCQGPGGCDNVFYDDSCENGGFQGSYCNCGFGSAAVITIRAATPREAPVILARCIAPLNQTYRSPQRHFFGKMGETPSSRAIWKICLHIRL